MATRVILLVAALMVSIHLIAAQSGSGTPGTMGVYQPPVDKPLLAISACPNSGWNPRVTIPDGQAVFNGGSSSCGVTYDVTSDYNRDFGVKATVRVVATCSGSGCYTFYTSQSTFSSIAQPGAQVPLSITYTRAS